MAYAYEIKPDNLSWGKVNSLEATHTRMLPGLRCPTCGVWAMTGIIYPSVDVVSIDSIAKLQSPWPVPVEQFKKMAASIQPILGPKRLAEPGAELGPLLGTAKGLFGDFAWVNPWTPLLRESVWLALRDAGFPLAGVRAELDFNQQPHEPLIEIEAIPTATLINLPRQEPCAVCGRIPMKKPDSITIDTASFDASIPLQRIIGMPTILVANESLAQYIKSRELRDVKLVPIEMS